MFVPFEIIDDDDTDPDESFTITLSIPSGGNATVWIQLLQLMSQQ